MTMQPGGGTPGGVMSSGNPIVGGTTLRIPAIQSPNYVPGSTGWAVFADGSAEFAGLKIDGGTLVLAGAGVILLYSGTPAAGNLTAAIAPVAGTDAFGNTWPAGVTLFGTDGTRLSEQVTGGAASLLVTPPTTPGHTWSPGSVVGNASVPAETFPPGLATHPALLLTSPGDAGATTSAQVFLYGGASGQDYSLLRLAASKLFLHGDDILLEPQTLAGASVTLTGGMSISGALSVTAGGTVEFFVPTVVIDQALKVATFPVRLCAGSVQNTSSVGPFTAETVTDQITVNAVDGRTYRIEYRGNFFSSIAGDVVTVRLREDSLTGTQLDSTDASMVAANRSYKQVLGMEWTAPVGSTGVPKTFVVTGVRTAGTGNITRQANATIPKALLTVDQVSL